MLVIEADLHMPPTLMNMQMIIVLTVFLSGCTDDIVTSDHSPVFGTFEVGVTSQFVSKKGTARDVIALFCVSGERPFWAALPPQVCPSLQNRRILSLRTSRPSWRRPAEPSSSSSFIRRVWRVRNSLNELHQWESLYKIVIEQSEFDHYHCLKSDRSIIFIYANDNYT